MGSQPADSGKERERQNCSKARSSSRPSWPECCTHLQRMNDTSICRARFLYRPCSCSYYYYYCYTSAPVALIAPFLPPAACNLVSLEISCIDIPLTSYLRPDLLAANTFELDHLDDDAPFPTYNLQLTTYNTSLKHLKSMKLSHLTLHIIFNAV